MQSLVDETKEEFDNLSESLHWAENGHYMYRWLSLSLSASLSLSFFLLCLSLSDLWCTNIRHRALWHAVECLSNP